MPSFRKSVQATVEAMKAGSRDAATEGVSTAVASLGDRARTVSVGGYGVLDCAMAIGSFVSIRVMGKYVAMELRDPSGFTHRFGGSVEQVQSQARRLGEFWSSFNEGLAT